MFLDIDKIIECIYTRVKLLEKDIRIIFLEKKKTIRYTTIENRELLKELKLTQCTQLTLTYGLVDEKNEQIAGNYSEQDLLRSVFNFDSNQKVLESMKVFHQFE